MSLFNFGADDAQNGSLNNMLNGVGIDDVGSFVNEFRQVAGSSGSEEGGNGFGDMFQGAMNAYKMFSGGKGKSGGGSGSGGNFFNQMGSTVENAQKMYEMYKKFDRNGDGKIAADDIEVILKEAGLGVASPCKSFLISFTKFDD